MHLTLYSCRSRLGTARTTGISLVVFLISQVLILFITRRLGPDFLGIQITFSSERFLQIATGWQAAGLLPDYYRHFILDYAHPLFYGVFLSSFMAYVFRRRGIPERFNLLLLLPFIASALDMAENTLHLYMLADFNRITPGMVVLSGTCTNVKWLLSSLCFLGSAVMLLHARPGKG